MLVGQWLGFLGTPRGMPAFAGLMRVGGGVVLAVWLRDVLGTFDDQHGLGQDARIGRWVVARVGEMSILHEPLVDGLLGRAAAQDARPAGGVGAGGDDQEAPGGARAGAR